MMKAEETRGATPFLLCRASLSKEDIEYRTKRINKEVM